MGFGNRNPVDADYGRGHVDAHEMVAESRQRLPDGLSLDVTDHQARKHFVSTFGDKGGKQALLVSELLVDVSFGSACAFDDRVNAGRRIALFKEKLGSRPEKNLPTTRRTSGLCCHHSRTPFTSCLTGNNHYRKRQW